MGKKNKPQTLDEKLAKKSKKPKFEESHERHTVYLERRIRNAINELVSTKEKGFKTALINHALERVLREEYGIKIDLM